jgi:hypothetical protein
VAARGIALVARGRWVVVARLCAGDGTTIEP